MQKNATTVRITHIPTGLSVIVRGRHRHKNLRTAHKEIEKKIARQKAGVAAAEKKADRDRKIHETRTIRTYDFKKGIVKDHRSGRKASLKKVLDNGEIDLLR